MKRLLRVFLFCFSLGLIVLLLSFFWVRRNFDHSFQGEGGCAVVFGAAVWRDDIPSHALFDRTVSALNLYQTDRVKCLVFSGGDSTYGSHEVDVMLKLAKEVDIPESDILLDYSGINTMATIKNLNGFDLSEFKLDKINPKFVLVSNDFHLARIQLLSAKFLKETSSTHKAKYNYGRYQKEQYFFWREVAGNIWYGLLEW